MKLFSKFFAFFFVGAISLSACTNPFEGEGCHVVSSPDPSPTPQNTVRTFRMMINTNIPANRVGPIVDAAGEWTTATSGAVTFTIEYSDFDVNEQPKTGEMRIWMKPNDHSGYIGYASWWYDENKRPSRSTIWIQDDLSLRIEYLVALHEIGHGLGLDHNDNEASIMHSSIMINVDHVPCIDRKSMCDVWGCDPSCQ